MLHSVPVDTPRRIPSKVTSQYLAVLSELPLINPLPSGVNSVHHTLPACPCHFATSLCVRESHIQRKLFKLPAATYRPSGLNATEMKKLGVTVNGRTFDDPSRMPYANRPIVGSRYKITTIWRESNAVDYGPVSLKHSSHSFFGDIPYLSKSGMRTMEILISKEQTLIWPSDAPVARSRLSGLNCTLHMSILSFRYRSMKTLIDQVNPNLKREVLKPTRYLNQFAIHLRKFFLHVQVL